MYNIFNVTAFDIEIQLIYNNETLQQIMINTSLYNNETLLFIA